MSTRKVPGYDRIYPAYVIKENNEIAGFCLLHAYNPFPPLNNVPRFPILLTRITPASAGTMALKSEEDALKVRHQNDSGQHFIRKYRKH